MAGDGLFADFQWQKDVPGIVGVHRVCTSGCERDVSKNERDVREGCNIFPTLWTLLQAADKATGMDTSDAKTWGNLCQKTPSTRG